MHYPTIHHFPTKICLKMEDYMKLLISEDILLSFILSVLLLISVVCVFSIDMRNGIWSSEDGMEKIFIRTFLRLWRKFIIMFQLCLKGQFDTVLVISYVLFNNYKCSFTVKDDIDPDSMEMTLKQVLEFQSIAEFEDVIQYCCLMQIIHH